MLIFAIFIMCERLEQVQQLYKYLIESGRAWEMKRINKKEAIDESAFVIKPATKNESPLDVEGVDLNLSRDEIIDILREVRER